MYPLIQTVFFNTVRLSFQRYPCMAGLLQLKPLLRRLQLSGPRTFIVCVCVPRRSDLFQSLFNIISFVASLG